MPRIALPSKTKNLVYKNEAMNKLKHVCVDKQTHNYAKHILIYRRPECRFNRNCLELMNVAARTTNITQTQLPSVTMSLCLFFKPVIPPWCHNSFVDDYYLLQMSMLPHLLLFYLSSVRMLFPAVPTALLLCTGPKKAFVLLSVPVTCSPSCSLPFSLSLSLPHPTSYHLFSGADNWSHGETCMFASGRGVKRGVENEEQDWRRGSLHLNACLLVVFWLTLSVWSLEFSFQSPSSDVKKMVHCKPGSITR